MNKWTKVGDLEFASQDDMAFVYYDFERMTWKLDVCGVDYIADFSTCAGAQHSYENFLRVGELIGEAETIQVSSLAQDEVSDRTLIG